MMERPPERMAPVRPPQAFTVRRNSAGRWVLERTGQVLSERGFRERGKAAKSAVQYRDKHEPTLPVRVLNDDGTVWRVY